VQVDEYLMVYLSATNALVIPKRAFLDNKAYQEFVDYIESHYTRK
jgi:hypothetical protein